VDVSDGRIVNLASPVPRAGLIRKLIDPRVEVVQFSSALTDSDYKRVAKALARHPRVKLRAYGSYDGSITDLDFLKFFPTLRSFSADALYHSLVNIDGLGYLPQDAEFIGIGQTKKRLSLAPLARFETLQRLYVEGQTKDIEVISELREIRSLTLRSVTLPDLSLLRPLAHLRALDLKLGGTKNLSELPDLEGIEYLELWMVKGLSDLTPVAYLPRLEYLFLQSLRQVTALPPMAGLNSLTRVWLETMKGLTDLSPLRDAPSLRDLAVIDMPHLQPEALEPLVGHPTLKTLRHGLGSKKKKEAVDALMGLPREAEWRKPARI
jgi:hypothetical protein